MAEGVVGGEGFAASLIRADVNRQQGIDGSQGLAAPSMSILPFSTMRPSAVPLLGWLVHERGIGPYIPVFDKSNGRMPEPSSSGTDG